MGRRRRGMRYINSRLLRVVLGGALLIWMGAMVVAFLNYQAPTEPESRVDATTPPSAPQTSDKERRVDQRLSSRRISKPPPAASRRKDARARADRRVVAQAATDRPDRSETKAQRQPPADEPAQDRADLAQLETEPDASVEPDTAPNRVVRAQFTTEIVEREPVNRIEAVFSVDGEVYSTDGRALQALYYFSEVEGMRGETLSHRWEHESEVVAETSFKVRGDPWSVYSRHDLAPAMGGDWRVIVMDAEGEVIRTDDFSYQSY